MFRIQNLSNREFLVMGDSTLPFDFQSTLFNKQDDFLGDKSFPSKHPLEPNRRFIRNAHLINSDNALREIMVMTWFDNMPFKEAKLIFQIDGKNLDITLYLNSSIIAPQLKSKKMPELSQVGVDGQLSFANMAEYKAYITGTTTAAPGSRPMYFFPYKNEIAYLDAAYVSYVVFNPGIVYNPGEVVRYTNRYYEVIQATSAGQTPVSNPEKFKDNTISTDLSLPVNPYINAWRVSPGEFIVNNDPVNIKETQTPFFTVAYVTRRILQYFGYQPAGQWLDSDIANRSCVFSNISCQAPIISDYVFFMPDVSASDYLKNLRTKFGLLIAFNQTEMICTIQSIQQMRGYSKVIDLRKKQLANTYRETGSNATGFRITQGTDDKDKAFTETETADLPVLTIGDISNTTDGDIKLLDVATKMLVEIAPAGSSASTWRIPNIKMPVYPVTPLDQVSDVKTADRANFALRFLYYHGQVPATSGELYPYGSSDNLDKDGTVLTPYSISLSIAAAAFSATKDYYTYLKDSRPFEMGFLLNRQDLIEITPDAKLLVKDFDETTVECFYDVMSADIGSGEQTQALITLYPDIQPDNKLQIVPVPGVPVDPPIPPPDNGVVYIKLILRNFKNIDHPFPPPRYQTINQDVVAKFYADAAGTISKDVVSLNVRLRIEYHNPTGSPATITESVINCTSTGGEFVLAANADQYTGQGGVPRDWEYGINPSVNYTVI